MPPVFYCEYRLFHYNLHCCSVGLGDDVHTLLQTADTVAARGVDCADIGHRGDAVYSRRSKLGMQLHRTIKVAEALTLEYYGLAYSQCLA